MFPCEMARYIAGFPQEARKSGRFCGPKASKPGTIRPRAVPITWIRPPATPPGPKRGCVTEVPSEAFPFRLNRNGGSIPGFDAFSSREPYPLRWKTLWLESHLCPHGNGVEIGTDLTAERGSGRSGRVRFIELAMHVVEHEAHVAIHVPVHAQRDVGLLAAVDGAGLGRD